MYCTVPRIVPCAVLGAAIAVGIIPDNDMGPGRRVCRRPPNAILIERVYGSSRKCLISGSSRTRCHTSDEFVAFLTSVVETQPRRREIHIIVDNLSAHKTQKALKLANLARLPHRRYSCVMRPLRYSINVTLDGCCDHRAMLADEDLHRHAVENLDQADALLFGRVTYEMMEAAWRPPARTGARPDWMEPFARTIDAAKKYVVSSTLDRVDWNAELVRGDLGKAVQQLKRESGKGLFVGGVKLPLALAELGLIDEYEFVVQPRLAGHGPTLFAGLSKRVDLKLVSRLEFGSGAVAMRYEPRR